MKTQLCTLGGGYGWEELWLDEERMQFSVKKYHCGSVDMSEEHYDGESELDTLTVLEKLVKENRLSLVLQYYDVLHGERDLDAVLSGLKQRSWLHDPAAMQLCGDRHLDYYAVSETEHAVYYMGTYCSVRDGGESSVDFTVVRRILDNRDGVVHYKFDYRTNDWARSKL